MNDKAASVHDGWWVEPREGIATVYGPNGQYLGCIGVERWYKLVREEIAREILRPRPDFDARIDHPERYSDGPY